MTQNCRIVAVAMATLAVCFGSSQPAAQGCVQATTLGVPFAANAYGDFRWMLTQPEFDDSVFVFNDNQFQFDAYATWKALGASGTSPSAAAACGAGGGNAAIRPSQCDANPRVAGIPTGAVGGYPSLAAPEAQSEIDSAIRRVVYLIQIRHATRVFFNSDVNDPDMLGHGIFNPGDDVKKYIVAQLRAAPAQACAGQPSH